MDERHVPVTLHSPPGDAGKLPATGTIADTPENRRLLEDAAIPKCAQWRSENPENGSPAPYCCSSYCDRCAGLRALNGVEPLLPNEWMTK
jgi:hypothetical protein